MVNVDAFILILTGVAMLFQIIFQKSLDFIYLIVFILELLNLFNQEEESMKNKVNGLTQEHLIYALNSLVSELNNEENGLNRKQRSKLDTITSKLDILINDIMYQGGEK